MEFLKLLKGKIEKVPRDIQCKKSRKDPESSEKLVSLSQQFEQKQVPKGMEPGVRKDKRSLLACHTRCKCSILRLCIAVFAVTEGWLLLDIGWFVFFMETTRNS